MNEIRAASGAALITLSIVAVASAQTTRYVNGSNQSPLAPYTSWETAATRIQDAVDAAQNGDTVLVTNGVYDAGGRVMYGSMMNRVAINKAVTVRSVNGADVTTIKGKGPLGDAAVRCAYVGASATLDGFTLREGHTRTGGDGPRERSGGGAWCDVGSVMRNCIIVACAASNNGGGAAGADTPTGGGTLYDCVISGNSAGGNGGGAFHLTVLYRCVLSGNTSSHDGGGADCYTFYDCTLSSNHANWGGGGAVNGVLHRCRLLSNSAGHNGGAFQYGTLYNCLVSGNQAALKGGGVWAGTSYNCTIVGNDASVSGGGAAFGTIINCVLWNNGHGNVDSSTVTSSWYLSDPAFVNPAGGDYRLSTLSPCIDAGTYYSWMASGTDLAGNPRLFDADGDGLARVDIGAYECQTPPPDPVLCVSSAHGTPSPQGTTTPPRHSVVQAQVDAVVASVGHQYCCAGWVGTGSVPASGTTNAISFTISSDSCLTWQWRTNFWLDVSSEGAGSVAGGNIWCMPETNAMLAVAPAPGWLFTGWSGDLQDDHTATNATVVMDGPKAVVAHFSDDADGDGLLNTQEWSIGTDPRLRDSDGDGFDDHFEHNQGMSPTNRNDDLLAYMATNRCSFGYYTADDIADMNPGGLNIAVSNNEVVLRLQVLLSTNLSDWVEAGTPIVWRYPIGTTGPRFFRVNVSEE